MITNYHLPSRDTALQVPVSVDYASDPERVERVLLEEARAASAEVPGLLAEPDPGVRLLPGFGESALQFTLFCRIREMGDQNAVLAELNRRILRRFRREGIEFPYPTRTVHLKDDRRS